MTHSAAHSSASSAVPPIINAAILDRLLHADSPVPLEILGEPTAVSNELDRLRAVGCELELHPQHGVRLTRCELGAWLDYVQWACPRPDHNVRPVEVYRSTTSTQDAARRLAERLSERADGAIAAADQQTAGRGRLGRAWTAPPGTAVTFSYAACSRASQPATIDRFTFATAVAVARAIEIVAGSPSLHARIKWPNDVMIDGRKIVGILVEVFPLPGRGGQVAAIGVGINVSLTPRDLDAAEPGLSRIATSLAAHRRHPDRLLVLTEAIRQMDSALNTTDDGALVREWKERCINLSQRIRLRNKGRVIEGNVIDLDPAAGLIVRTDEGQIVHLPAATTTVL